MARYCIAFQSMKLFLNLEGTEELSELVGMIVLNLYIYKTKRSKTIMMFTLYILLKITIVCQCKEFSDLKIRNNEKKVLNTLNKDKNRITIRYI